MNAARGGVNASRCERTLADAGLKALGTPPCCLAKQPITAPQAKVRRDLLSNILIKTQLGRLTIWGRLHSHERKLVDASSVPRLAWELVDHYDDDARYDEETASRLTPPVSARCVGRADPAEPVR
jgi:hypothetical protein